MQDHITFRLLGGFAITHNHPEPRPIHISSPRQRALLAYLALQPGYVATRERLATLVWDDCDDGQARKRFRQSLLRLRREFAEAGADPLIGDRDTLGLNGEMVTVDAREFLALAKAGEHADPQMALDLYQGDLLDGLGLDVEPFAEWINQERSRLRVVAAEVFERLIDAQQRRDNADGALAAAERLVGLDAANEAAQRRLIELLARHRGRTAALMRAEAVAQFVKDEFGCELEPETQKLIANIRSAPAPEREPRQQPRAEAETIAATAPLAAAQAAAAAEDAAAAEIVVTAEEPPVPRGAPLADTPPRATPFSRPPWSARWIWASYLGVLAVAVAAVALPRTSSGPATASAPAVNEVRAPAAAASQSVEFVNTAAALQPAEQKAAPERQHFDGTWTTMIACPSAKGAAAYTIPMEAEVKDGVFHAERGTEGKPNRLTVDGAIQLDGSTELLAQGLTGDSVYTVGGDRPGSLYAYHIRAKFEGPRGTGSRVELRPCAFTAIKR